ncbi:MAG TPA: hypothetical protein VF800_09105 [Telluria sp.]|jgi:hypothetical protein
MTWFKDTPQTSLRSSVKAWWKALLARRTDNQEGFDWDRIEEDLDMESTTLSWAEQMQEIGFQKGLALAEKAKEEGIAGGQVIALRKVVGSLLRNRFGELPAPAAQLIAQAAQDQLEQWFERSLDAPSLAAVFGEDPASR